MTDFLCKIVASRAKEITDPLTPKTTKIQFVLRTPPKWRHILLDCSPEETVLAIKKRLSELIGVGCEPAFLRLVFCGQSLADGMQISALELGPTTSLTLLMDTAPNLDLSSPIGHPAIDWPVGACSTGNDSADEEEWVKLSSDQFAENAVNFSDESAFSAFFVFCKSCDSLECAKLRAYCRTCESSAIIFLNEPQQWDDVKENNSIRIFCHHCDKESGVSFRFKCVKCGEPSSPLQHISRNFSLPPSESGGKIIFSKTSCFELRASKTSRFLGFELRASCFEKNWASIRASASSTKLSFAHPCSECVICGSNSFPLGVRLRDCIHLSCVQCFVAYAEELLSRMSLKWHPQVGYTVGCPFYGCTAVVTDVHTLYLLGKPSYQHYHQLAAQLFFSAQTAERSQHCPWPNCGAAFLVEGTDEKSVEQTADEVFLCPECSRMICRRCSSTKAGGTDRCKCVDNNQNCLCCPTDAESASLIRRTTKQCPHCEAPTERNGGCAHIRCTQCQSEWCFVCLKLWNDNCQWDHWFE
ncbi:hypothetical protein niasHS_003436 [Heterodera schachtii]|uniref:RBR-type E3 ubiquitin transferase n=1 Tax=Heterodera schachtii TaxID=97005 RepID=A0ABD2KGV9_HETSC